jgi:hypothetical protein
MEPRFRGSAGGMERERFVCVISNKLVSSAICRLQAKRDPVATGKVAVEAGIRHIDTAQGYDNGGYQLRNSAIYQDSHVTWYCREGNWTNCCRREPPSR